jgi:hypothetical protein
MRNTSLGSPSSHAEGGRLGPRGCSSVLRGSPTPGFGPALFDSPESTLITGGLSASGCSVRHGGGVGF